MKMNIRGVCVQLSEYRGVVEVWSRDIVPGEAGRSTSFEGRDVVYEVGDYHFHNLRRETTRLGRVFVGIWILACEYGLEFGFGTVPNGVGEALDTYDKLTTNRNSKGDAEGFARYLITMTWGSLGVLCRGPLSTWMYGLREVDDRLVQSGHQKSHPRVRRAVPYVSQLQVI